MAATQPPPESASPALADGLAVTVTQIYADAETQILAAVTSNVRAALSAESPGVALQSRAGTVQSTARRVMDRADSRARRAVPGALAEAYGRGHGLERRVVSSRLQDVLGRLGTLRNGVLRWLTRLWSRLTAATYGPADPKPIIERVLQREAGRGITAFIDPRGRNWPMPTYAASALQVSAGNAAIDGFLARVADAGDLVIVTESAHPCPICRPWEHRLLSVSGLDPKHPSMATARQAGLFHPNCHHTIFRWFPGFTWPPYSTVHEPGTYEAVQRQRDIERQIRAWKRREAAALDDVTRLKARTKVRDWQADLRRHLAAEGLKRSRQRERTDYGHTPSIRHAYGPKHG